jgi:hypothetical protein
VDAVRELAQLRQAGLELVRESIQEIGELRVVAVRPAADQPEQHRRGHEALLCAVVEVALEASARLIGSFDDPDAGCLQLGRQVVVVVCRNWVVDTHRSHTEGGSRTYQRLEPVGKAGMTEIVR